MLYDLNDTQDCYYKGDWLEQQVVQNKKTLVHWGGAGGDKWPSSSLTFLLAQKVTKKCPADDIQPIRGIAAIEPLCYCSMGIGMSFSIYLGALVMYKLNFLLP